MCCACDRDSALKSTLSYPPSTTLLATTMRRISDQFTNSSIYGMRAFSSTERACMPKLPTRVGEIPGPDSDIAGNSDLTDSEVIESHKDGHRLSCWRSRVYCRSSGMLYHNPPASDPSMKLSLEMGRESEPFHTDLPRTLVEHLSTTPDNSHTPNPINSKPTHQFKAYTLLVPRYCYNVFVVYITLLQFQGRRVFKPLPY